MPGPVGSLGLPALPAMGPGRRGRPLGQRGELIIDKAPPAPAQGWRVGALGRKEGRGLWGNSPGWDPSQATPLPRPREASPESALCRHCGVSRGSGAHQRGHGRSAGGRPRPCAPRPSVSLAPDDGEDVSRAHRGSLSKEPLGHAAGRLCGIDAHRQLPAAYDFTTASEENCRQLKLQWNGPGAI